MKNKKIQPSMTAIYYDYDLLSPKAKKFLPKSFCINDNPKKVWFGKDCIIEYYLEEDENMDESCKEIPEDWWNKLDLDPKLRKQIETHFKNDSENVVIFCYAGDELEE
jgi:hypothetical protein